MINRLLFIFLAVCGALNAGAQSIDAFPRTTSIVSTDLLLVQTNSAGAAGQKFTRSITGSNLLESLMDFSNWSGGSGSVTNAVLTNIIATGAITNVGSALLSASNYYARVVSLTTNDNVSLTLSNAQNNTAYILAPGSYAITPSVLSSNLTGGTQYRGITFANKTNVLIYGQKGSTIIDGSSEYGELLVITNSSGITVDGLAFYGKTNHNWVAVVPTNHIWAGIRIANSEKITFQNNDISRHFNHGICDLAANFSAVPASTNQIIIQNNLFEDAGSWRTNFPSPFDGTAIVPTGWTVRGNKIKNVFRGIEPYLANDGQPSVIWNCIIENNEIENAYDAGITPAGNTNFHGVRISGNTIRNHPGFAYHGSNALYSSGAAIVWNGGPKWSIDNNIISGAFPYGIQIGGSVVDGSITGNRIAEMTNDAAAVGIIAQSAYRLKISGNRISGAKAAAMQLYGLRDSDVSDNQLVNPSYTGNAIRISTFAPLTASNLTVRNNFIFDSRGILTNAIEDQLGTTYKIRLIGNDIQGALTNYHNLSGAEWTIRDHIAGSTNRLIAAHEVRTQIEAGSNITLATNSSGVVTITGSAGGGGVGPTNANQFGASLTLSIKDGALLTNTSIRTALTLPTLTVSRAAVLNSSGQLTNSAAVSDVELEYLDGVTSAIQTQLGTKTALATNSSQFGASTVLTIADRVSLTNLNSYGTGAVFSGHVTVTSNITAQSFIGSGTGVPILKLQTMMAADNAFAITVATNRIASTTNTFDFTNAAVNDVIKVHSSSAGQIVWTNGAAASGGGGNPGATIEDHFIGGGTASGAVGELSWSYSAVAASYAGSDGHPGVFQFSGNVSGTVYYLYTGIGDVTSSGNLASLGWTNTVVARIGNATSLTNSTFRLGWANDLTSTGPAHMVALNCTNGTTPGTWFATVASNSVLSSLTTSITASTGWITNEVRSTGASNITFVVNGTALSAIPFCPSVGMRAFFQVIPSEASSKLAEVDFWRFRPSLGY